MLVRKNRNPAVGGMLMSAAFAALLLGGCANGDTSDTDDIEGTRMDNDMNTGMNEGERDTAAMNDSIANYNDRRDRDTSNGSGTLGYYTMLEQDQNRIAMNPSYTTSTLDSLVRALETTAVRVDYNFDKDRELLGTNITTIRTSSEPLRSSQNIKSTFMTAINVFRQIQKKSFPDLKDRIDDVEEKVEVIDAARPASEQKDKIRAVFHEMEDLIREMNDEVEDEAEAEPRR